MMGAGPDRWEPGAQPGHPAKERPTFQTPDALRGGTKRSSPPDQRAVLDVPLQRRFLELIFPPESSADVHSSDPNRGFFSRV